jgi:hypothetical protein
MGEPVIEALCRIPVVLQERGDVSAVQLFHESGCATGSTCVSQSDIEAYLRSHPDLVRAWVAYSEDKRSSPDWYLAQPGAGLDGKDGWRVGYYPSEQPERVFADEYTACGFFIMREVEKFAPRGRTTA